MLTSPPLLVGATIGTWSGVLVANTGAKSCRRIALPDSRFEPVVFSGNRLAYASYSEKAIWVGRIGSPPQRIATPDLKDAGPVFVGSRVAYVARSVIRFVGGGSLTPRLPAGSIIEALSAHGNALLITASWGSGVKGTLRTAVFTYRGGVTQRIENEPDPYGEMPQATWSPDGRRIAYTSGGDLWTVSADGTGATQISRTAKALEGGPVWSPDSGQVAYWTNRHGPRETYVAPATGGTETRLTRTKEPRDTGIVRVGTQPQAWLGDQIAVTSDTSIGTVPSAGGAVSITCGQPRTTLVAYSGLAW